MTKSLAVLLEKQVDTWYKIALESYLASHEDAVILKKLNEFYSASEAEEQPSLRKEANKKQLSSAEW